MRKARTVTRGVLIISSADISATDISATDMVIFTTLVIHTTITWLVDINTNYSAHEIYFIYCMLSKSCYYFPLNKF